MKPQTKYNVANSFGVNVYIRDIRTAIMYCDTNCAFEISYTQYNEITLSEVRKIEIVGKYTHRSFALRKLRHV